MVFQSSPYWFLVFLLLIICYVEVSIANSVSTLQPSCPDHEKSALLEVKHNFIIDCTVASGSPDAYPTTSTWTAAGDPKDLDCCLWDGVECSNETGHVIGLDLGSSCLYGSLPPNTTLFSLPYLEELNLANNDFNNSPIPPGLGHKLSKLTNLNLSVSALSGEVPSDISELSRLTLLDLSFNSGLQLKAFSLERLVRNLTQLNILYMDSVDISSPLPNILANLTSLRAIVLRLCNLYGEFPTSIFHLPHLQELDLSGNNDLAGFLPRFEHTTPLRTLVLEYTSFSGELPPSIGSLAHMEELRLSDSKFSGQVPSSIGNLTKLFYLELSGSYFSGDIPFSFTNLTQLQYLSLSDLNATPDKLFSWLSKLNNLLSLELQSMNLTGEIPSIMANFTSLRHLNLIGNHLTGHIPHWLMNLTHLELLALSDNKLEGSISPRISQLEYLVALYLNGNENLHVNVDTLLRLKTLIYLDLAGLALTFPGNITNNESIAKLTLLRLDSCNLTEFPPFLHSQDELRVLELMDNGFRGVIPQWFVDVTKGNLLYLDLSSNFLTGFEQPAGVLPWGNLEILYLERNKIQGSLPIPPSSLMMYHISDNLLTGEIPQEFCHASALNYLDLSFNNLGGQVPECIGQLGGSLGILSLQGNNFHGTIPSVYPKSCKLKMINLSQNRFTSTLPRSLANCKMIEVLDIGSNRVNDSFPSWLGSLPNLQILILRHNNFHGRIGRPNATFGFPSLHIIDLSHNFHTGGLPSDYLQNWDAMKVVNEAQSTSSGISVSIKLTTPHRLFLFPVINYKYTITISNKGNDMLYTKILTVLRVIDFSSNNFTGRIPNIIGELKGLQAINLSNNNLNGGIPLSLANVRDLESLDLSNNKLSREIPQQLAQLTSLEVCNVSHNLLVGPIPQGNQFDTFDNSSFDGNSGLCGGTLSKKCGNVHEPPPSALVTDNDKDDDSNVIDWVIRSLGCVSGFVIGYVIGKYMTDRHHEWFVETFRGRKRRTRTKPRRRS